MTPIGSLGITCRLQVFPEEIERLVAPKRMTLREVQISEEKRLDIVITYLDRKYVVELKLRHGQKAHEKGIGQLNDYLGRAGVNSGYLVIYDLRENGRKEWKQDRMIMDGKEIFMVWV